VDVKEKVLTALITLFTPSTKGNNTSLKDYVLNALKKNNLDERLKKALEVEKAKEQTDSDALELIKELSNLF
jgi:hypothetical protein